MLLCMYNCRICAARNVEYTTNIFDFSPPGIGHIFIYMTLEGIVFMALTILIEVGLLL